MHCYRIVFPWGLLYAGLILSIACGGHGRLSAAELVIVQDGQPRVKIVVGQRCSRPSRFAAEELQKTLRQMSGATCPIVSDDPGGDAPLIAIGPPSENPLTARLLGRAGVDLDALRLGEEGFLLRSVDANLLIAGGTAPRATLYGVYAFLEGLGCRWCFPAEHGDVIPRQSTVKTPPLDRVEKPAFSYRTFSHTASVSEETIDRIDWMAKNRMNRFLTTLYPIKGFQGQWYHQFKKVPGLVDAIQKRGMLIEAGHHASYVWTSPTELFDSHPSWFAMVGGVRKAVSLEGARAQLCWTNEEMARFTAERIVEFAHKNPEADVLSIYPDDDYGYCECPQCVSAGSISNAYVTYVNNVARRVHELDPKVRLAMLSYNKIDKPPTIAVFGENTLCAIACWIPNVKQIQGWIDAGPKDIVLYQYYMGSYSDRSLPGVWPHIIDETIKTIHKLGVSGITSQGEVFTFGVYGLNYWTYARLIWDPTQPVDDVLDDYFTHYYAEAADPMRAYFAAMEVVQRCPKGGCEHISEASIRQLDELLRAAEEAAKTTPVRARICRDRIALDYLRGAWEIQSSWRKAQEFLAGGTRQEAIDQLKHTVEACKHCLDHLHKYRDRRVFLMGRKDVPEEIIGYRYTTRWYELDLEKAEKLLAKLQLPSGRQNLALMKKATAQSVYSKGSTAQKAVDGDPATGWAAGRSPKYPERRTDPLPQSLSIDLGKVRTLGAILLKTPGKYYQYRIEVSEDGRQWKPVVTKQDKQPGNPDPGILHVFPKVQARYIRSTFTASTDHLAYVYELEAYEDPPSK